MVDFSQYALAGVQKLKPYQPGKPVEELERELGISDIIKLASNENPLGASPKAQQALIRAASDLATYPDGSAYRLKNKLADKLQVTPEQITVGNGSNDILELISLAFLDRDAGAVFSQHAFAVYPLATMARGAELQIAAANPSDHTDMPYGSNLNNLLAQIQSNTRVVFLANPNNPTGTWVKEGELYQFIKQIPEHIIVVLDEAYTEYVTDADFPDALPWLDEFPNLVITRTFSKIYGLAAVRVGYAVSHPQISDLLNRVRQPFNVNTLALAAAEAALDDDDFITRSVAMNSAGMAQWVAACDANEWRYIPSQGNFITVDIGQPGMAVYETLLQAGVIVRPVDNYGLGDFVRITIGTQAQNARCIAALLKVGA